MNLIVSSPCAGRTWTLSILKDCKVKCNYSHVGSQHSNPISIEKIEQHITGRYDNDNIVCIYRDIKDHMVSKYFHCIKRVKLNFDSISDFIRDDIHGTEKLIRFNLAWRKIPTVKFISYEELVNNALYNVKQLISFFGYELDNSIIDQAITNNLFQVVQAREIEVYGGIDPEALKARRGIIGGYVDYLSQEDIQYIDNLVLKYDYINRMNA
jgi:hypothetical protein